MLYDISPLVSGGAIFFLIFLIVALRFSNFNQSFWILLISILGGEISIMAILSDLPTGIPKFYAIVIDPLLLTLFLAPIIIRLNYFNKHLNNEQALLRSIIDSIPDLIFFKDLEGKYLGCNRGFEKFINHSETELKGKTDLAFYSTELAEKFINHDQHVLAKAKTECDEIWFKYPDGKQVLMETLKQPFSDAQGNILGLVSINHDITARHLEQEQLRLASTVFKNTGEGILITNANREIISVNQAFTDITGFDIDDIKGKNPNILSSGRQNKAFYQRMWQDILTTGQWQGEIWNRRKNGETYPEWLSITQVKDNKDCISHYIGIFSDITERKAAEEYTAYLAFYDPLTSLANRHMLQERLEYWLSQAERDASKLALLFLDLDNFKYINDTLGHGCGDQLLCIISDRLQNSTRKNDTVSRFGGDEFIIILPDTGFKRAALVAEKILRKISEPITIQGHELTPQTSIGISLYPDDGTDLETLIKHADTAMYQAKNSGKGNHQFFAAHMNDKIHQRFTIENELHHALERNEFRLCYQPQLDLVSGKVVGMEALIRWQHPTRGLISPADFIPIAEESQLIINIGEWVITTACAQIHSWLEKYGASPNIAINISSKQLHDSELSRTIRKALRQYHILPRYLELELTESIMMNDIHSAIKFMDEMSKLGILISIDDFGTGYSSLTYLKKLSLDKLKIDQSFVRDILNDSDDAAIVKVIITMAKNLGLKVIAEGVETKQQLEFLKRENCDEIQGYYISPPLPPEELTNFSF